MAVNLLPNHILTRDELLALGFTSIGTNVSVSRKASLYGISGSIGDHVRIDDFCTLKGRIIIGNHVHIAGYCSISGACAEVTIQDFVGIANRVSIYTGSDDYKAFGGTRADLPGQEIFNQEQVSLPIHYGMSDEDLNNVCDAIKKGW